MTHPADAARRADAAHPDTSTNRSSVLQRGVIGLSAALLGWAGVAALRGTVRALVRRAHPLDGRVVLITGGARGLGLALARAFARDGARLVLVSRTVVELERARQELAASGADVQVVAHDIRDAGGSARLVAEVVARTGRLDVLVNDAGIIQMAPFAAVPDADIRDSLDTHVWGPLHLIRAALPHVARSRGSIVNVSSIGGRVAVPHLLPYCVGKFALAGLSEGLHAELAATGVHVLTVTPGLLRSGSHRNVRVRGAHVAEARWFGLASATSLTSMRVDRAADRIVRACRERRAQLTLGVQARALEIAHVLAPGAVAGAMRLAAWVLPAAPPTPEAERARLSRTLDLGWVSALMPSGTAAAMNQPSAVDDR